MGDMAPKRVKDLKIHFMGIGGIGVSALAEMARAAGAVVSGCDQTRSGQTDSLTLAGVKVYLEHAPDHMDGNDLLVYSSAIPADHPERVAAGGREMKRGEFLAWFMSRPGSIGIAGTHGKTTTTWMLGHLLIETDNDPSLFVGGMVPGLEHGNYRLGSGRFVAELDESDGSFLLPKLDVAVITNIESDHLSYYQDFSAVRKAFAAYAEGVREKGLLVACVDDHETAELFAGHAGRKLGCGLGSNAELRATEIEHKSDRSEFRVIYRDLDMGRTALPMHGKHNIQNALLALGVCFELGCDIDGLESALATMRSVARRLEKLGTIGKTAVYSDYAHHPTEVGACIAAARQAVGGKLLVVFQPHLFSRTRDYADEFGAALSNADAVVLTEIYPARESPIPGVTAALLADAIRDRNSAVTGPIAETEIAAIVREKARDFDAVVMMGAGSIDAAARAMMADIRAAAP